MEFLIMAAAGFILAAWSFRKFRQEQRRRRILARLQRAIDPTGRAYPGGGKWERGF